MTTEPAIRIGSLNQFQIALYASKDKRLSACDLACLFEIVDRFLKDDGVTRPTGKTHLERETGRSNGSVKESLRRLVEWRYISVAKIGSGTRGTEYLPNFEWANRVASAIKAEVKDRAEAKKKRRSSGAENRTTSAQKLVGRNYAPLRDLVGQPTAPLDGLVGQNSAPQTYVTPTGGDYVGNKSAPEPGASALRQAPVRADFDIAEFTIDYVSVDKSEEDGSDFIYISMATDNGEFEQDDCIFTQSDDQKKQEEGQQQLASLMRAVGMDEIKDANDLLGRKLMARICSAPGCEPLRYVYADDTERNAA